MGFQEPTPIQKDAIPVALAGHDVVGLAQTGTGKTAAFGVPLMSHMALNTQAAALVLVPTRELAHQVVEVLKKIGARNQEIRIVTLIGGMAMQPQTRQLQKGFRVLVATPGRLVDHMERQQGLLSKVKVVVLDEADRMLDMGFAPQLKRVFQGLTRERQTMLFSATMPDEIKKMAMQFLREPVWLQAGPVSTPIEKIEQRVLRVNGEDKNETLLDEINARVGSVLVFIRTQHRTDRVAKYLNSYGLTVDRIHGRRTQGQRNRALQGFRNEEFRVLCATDIASRGIDIDHVAHVINYDLPQVPEDYVHRIGRTARAGRTGESISFVSSDQMENWRAIEKLLHKKGGAPKFESQPAKTKSARPNTEKPNTEKPKNDRAFESKRNAERPRQPFLPKASTYKLRFRQQ